MADRKLSSIQSANNPDYKKIKQAFLSELKKASSNKKSSLSYIEHSFSPAPLVSKGIFQTIVIGGTNYISALSEITIKKNTILKIKKGKMPVFKTAKDFSSFLNYHLNKKAEALGINFAFPLKPFINKHHALDGILIHGTKEHAFERLIGQAIGEFAGNIYFEKYKRQIPVTVANDTVCLTLADNGEEAGGMVVGTGFNLSLKITAEGKKSVVNLEAGNFNGFEFTDVLKIIDRKSERPGRMLFEKAIAGKYLVTYFNEKAKALQYGIQPLKTSADLSRLAATENKKGQTKPPLGRDLARTLLERSASLIACSIAGIYEFKNNPKKLEFITEGSLFWKGYMYQENVQKQLLELGVPKNIITFKYIEDSSLKGTIGLLTH